MDNIEDRKSELELKLNTLFVESYDTLKEAVNLINMSFDAMNINYKYTYDEFCKDFANEMLEYQDKNPECDMSDANNIVIYTGFIIVSMINKIKLKLNKINDN